MPDAVASCRTNQKDIEIIVVDDGSTDATAEWLRSQPDLVVISQENLGKCWAINKALHIAQGHYIKFLDSDDMVPQGILFEQLDIAANTDADVIVSGYQLINMENEVLKTQPWIICSDFIAQQLGECDGSHYSAFLFKKSFIQDIPHRPDYALRDDRLFILEIATKSPRIAIHPGIGLLHRIHDHSRLQNNKGLKAAVQNYQHLSLYRLILDRLQRTGDLTPRRIDASLKILWPLCNWIAKHHLDDGCRLFEWILELKPDFRVPEQDSKFYFYKLIGFRTVQQLLRVRRFILYR